jgi:aspartyl-tRNA(Asn)/glutamyl-tRNA(Gln) amidotransferase subunit C
MYDEIIEIKEVRRNMSVSKKDVEYVAELARLSFSDKEKEGLIHDLNNVLGYIEKLNELDTDNVDIIVNPYFIENKFRDDEYEESMQLSEVLINAPDSLEEYILVPKVIE